jgi:hypothetical protein
MTYRASGSISSAGVLENAEHSDEDILHDAEHDVDGVLDDVGHDGDERGAPRRG